MNLQHKVCLCTETNNFELLNIFVDNKPIKGNNSKYVWYGDTGYHTIKIEQDKIIKSKYYWILCPLFFLLSLFTGDIKFDGKTPFYAVYEAEIYVDKDIEVNAELYDVNKNIKKSKQGFYYKIAADFPKEIEVKVIKNDFTTKPQERRRWFLYFASLWTVVFASLIYIFTLAGFNSFARETALNNIIFWSFLSCLSIVGWIFFVLRYYKWSNGEY